MDVLHPEMEAEIRGLLGFPPRILSNAAEKAYRKGEEVRKKFQATLPIDPPGEFPPRLLPPPPTFVQGGGFRFTKN